MTPFEVVQRLEQTPGKLDKEAIVREAWQAGCVEFFEGAKLAYDKMVTFGVAKLPLKSNDSYAALQPWPLFNALARALQRRELTGNAAKKAIQDFADSCWQNQWNDWYRRVLLGDLNCGITEGTINRVIDKLGPDAAPFRVPVFAIQRAHSGNEHPHRLKGNMLLDYKFDGIRLPSFLTRWSPEVLQFTRSGKPNKNFRPITDVLGRITHMIKDDLVLDGEVMSSNFNSILKVINKKAHEVDTSDAVLVVFDVVSMEGFKNGFDPMTQRQRHERLLRLQPMFDSYCDGKVVVLDKTAVDLDTEEGREQLEAMKATAAEVIDEATGQQRFEGVMAKNPDAPYEGKKGYHWLKIKPHIEVDLKIVGYTKGDPNGKRAGKIGGFIVEGVDEDSDRFIRSECGGGISDKLIDYLTAHPEAGLGQIVTIRAKEITQNEDGLHSLREPRLTKFRSLDGTPGEKD